MDDVDFYMFDNIHHTLQVLKWRSSDTPSSVTTRDHYFVIRYGGGAPHNLTLCYIPLLGDAPATVTNDQLSFAPASFDVALA